MNHIVEGKLKKVIGVALYNNAKKRYDKEMAPVKDYWRNNPLEKFSKGNIKKLKKEGDVSGAKERAKLRGGAYNAQKRGLFNQNSKLDRIRAQMRLGTKLKG